MTEIKKIREVINEVFFEEFKKNHRRILLGEEILHTTIRPFQPVLSAEFRKKFSKKIIDHPPLIEELFPGIGLGLNIGGFDPVIQYDWGGLLPLFLNQLHVIGNWRYRMAEQASPGVIVRMGDGGNGFAGPELSSAHLAHALHVPNLRIAIPSTPYHMKGLWRTAFAGKYPVLFIEVRREYETSGPVPKDFFTVPFGSSALFRTGTDVTIVTWGFYGRIATHAAEVLKRDGINAEILVLQTLHPIDHESIRKSLAKTGRAVIVEEEMLRGGVGAEICAQISEALPGVRLMRLAAKNVPRPSRHKYLHYVIPNEENIVVACRAITAR